MNRFFLSVLFGSILMLFAKTSSAQYNNALGVRLGDSYGITFKTFIQPTAAIDAILHVRNNDNRSVFRISGLYEIHNEIPDLPGLFWYYGGGASIGSVDYKKSDKNDFLLSADGVLGLDYEIEETPLVVSLDWKPAFEFTPRTRFDARGFGLSVRIAF